MLTDAELAELERATSVFGSDRIRRVDQYLSDKHDYVRAATPNAILSLIAEVRQRRADGERLAELEAVVGRLAASDPLYEAPNGWFCVYCDAPGSEEQAIRMRGSESWPHHASCSWLAARRFAGSGSK